MAMIWVAQGRRRQQHMTFVKAGTWDTATILITAVRRRRGHRRQLEPGADLIILLPSKPRRRDGEDSSLELPDGAKRAADARQAQIDKYLLRRLQEGKQTKKRKRKDSENDGENTAPTSKKRGYKQTTYKTQRLRQSRNAVSGDYTIYSFWAAGARAFQEISRTRGKRQLCLISRALKENQKQVMQWSQRREWDISEPKKTRWASEDSTGEETWPSGSPALVKWRRGGGEREQRERAGGSGAERVEAQIVIGVNRSAIDPTDLASIAPRPARPPQNWAIPLTIRRGGYISIHCMQGRSHAPALRPDMCAHDAAPQSGTASASSHPLQSEDSKRDGHLNVMHVTWFKLSSHSDNDIRGIQR
ncbi:hypothetical protein K438DRAFT_1768200 [Mycena galopus ATCC 62051]|nr:hypothetical protein K438DRAFT_1768200 [Mycena galopus ATCC 62051]